MNVTGLEGVFKKAIQYLENGKGSGVLYQGVKDNHELAEHIFQNVMKLKRSYLSSGKDPFYEIILSAAIIFKNIKGLNNIEDVFKYCVDLAKVKNSDYGGSKDNIGLSGVDGMIALLINKACRVHNLTHKDAPPHQVKDEPIWKTAEDIVNYAAFAPMLIDGTWKGENA